MQKYFVCLASLALVACGSGSSSSVYTPGNSPPDTQTNTGTPLTPASDREGDDDVGDNENNQGSDADGNGEERPRRPRDFRADPRLDKQQSTCAIRVGSTFSGPARMGGGASSTADTVSVPCMTIGR